MIPLSGADLVLPDRILASGTIIIEDGRIAEVRAGAVSAGGSCTQNGEAASYLQTSERLSPLAPLRPAATSGIDRRAGGGHSLGCATDENDRRFSRGQPAWRGGAGPLGTGPLTL